MTRTAPTSAASRTSGGRAAPAPAGRPGRWVAPGAEATPCPESAATSSASCCTPTRSPPPLAERGMPPADTTTGQRRISRVTSDAQALPRDEEAAPFDRAADGEATRDEATTDEPTGRRRK